MPHFLCNDNNPCLLAAIHFKKVWCFGPACVLHVHFFFFGLLGMYMVLWLMVMRPLVALKVSREASGLLISGCFYGLVLLLIYDSDHVHLCG